MIGSWFLHCYPWSQVVCFFFLLRDNATGRIRYVSFCFPALFVPCASCVHTISLFCRVCSWLRLIGLFLLFIQVTRSDSPSQQAQDLTQLIGQVLDILGYSLDMTITLWIQLFSAFPSQRNITFLSLRQTVQTFYLSLLRGGKTNKRNV